MATEDILPIIVQTDDDGREELKLCGDIDVRLSAELHSKCVQIARQGRDAVVDCEDVSSFDASAFQLLTALKDALALQGRDFQLVGVSPSLAGSFGSAGLKQYFLAHNLP
jgi:anti-anti-sigma factor